MLNFSDLSFYDHLSKNEYATQFIDIINIDSKQAEEFQLKGRCRSGVVRGAEKYGGVYQLPVYFDREYLDGKLSEVSALFKGPKLKKYKMKPYLHESCGDSGPIYFKIRTNSLGNLDKDIKCNIDLDLKDEKLDLKGCDVSVTCVIGVYFNISARTYGLFYRVKGLDFE